MGSPASAAPTHTGDQTWGAFRLYAPILIAAGSIVLLFVRSLQDRGLYDLSYILTAGRLWAAGRDPYGAAFVDQAPAHIPAESAIWVYPPQWWGLATALGALSDTAALIAWTCVSLAALGAGCWLLYRVSARDGHAPGAWPVAFFIAAMATADPTRITLHLGQTSLIMVLGFGLLVNGMSTGRPAQMAWGLVLLMLKPQLGAYFLLLAGFTPAGRKPALMALLITGLACLPILLSFGPAGTLASAQNLLANLSIYGDLPWNRPIELTGPVHLLAWLGAPPLPPLLWVPVASGLAALLLRSRPEGTAVDPLRFWLVSLAALYAVLPLHSYDFVLVPSLLLLISRLHGVAVAAILLAVVAMWRVSSSAFGYFGDQLSSSFDGVYIGSLIQAGVATLAGLLVLAAALGRFRKDGCWSGR